MIRALAFAAVFVSTVAASAQEALPAPPAAAATPAAQATPAATVPTAAEAPPAAEVPPSAEEAAAAPAAGAAAEPGAIPAGKESSGEEFFPGSEKPRKWSVGVGAGINYFDFAQTSDIYSDIAFKSLLGPSFSIDARANFTPTDAAEISYAKHPGEIKGGAGINVESQYNWRHLTIEWVHRLKSWPEYFKQQTRSETYLRVGGQYHVLPYYDVGPGTLTLRDRSVGMASLGVEHFVELMSKWRFQIFMRYQYPVIKEGLHSQSPSMRPKFAFDGSIGGQYRVTEAWNIGIFWYGQWHEFSFPVDVGGGVGTAGGGTYDVNQKLFFSNLELNLSYDF